MSDRVASIVLDFAADGSVQGWPHGDLEALARGLVNLAAAILVDPGLLPQLAGTAGAPGSTSREALLAQDGEAC